MREKELAAKVAQVSAAMRPKRTFANFWKWLESRWFRSLRRKHKRQSLRFHAMAKDAGHPAQLNLGDCFAYAVAKNNRRVLLFRGDDFDQTDIGSASRSR
jgi:uncharacterized protein with PIN domain